MNHLSGCGCFYCKKDVKTTSDFIKKANILFNKKYNYENVKYVNKSTKVEIICPTHGVFYQIPCSHLSGKGCKRCTYNIDNTSSFTNKSNDIHNNLYDYTNVNYINSQTKVEIKCKIHGSFWQTPSNHIGKAYGCPMCFNKTSKMENKWISEMKINIQHRQYKIGSFFVDGFDPINNIIYEFYGDFWHGNPNIYNHNDINKVIGVTFGELYNRTIIRENKLKKLGYSIISKWESDFKNESLYTTQVYPDFKKFRK